MNIYVNKYSINRLLWSPSKPGPTGDSEGRENPREVGDLFRKDYPTKSHTMAGQENAGSGWWVWTSQDEVTKTWHWGGIGNNKVCRSVSIVYKHHRLQQNRQGNESLETVNDPAETPELVQSREEIQRQHRGLGLGLENTGCPRSHVKTRWSDADGKMSPPLHSLLKKRRSGWIYLPSKCLCQLDPRA